MHDKQKKKEIKYRTVKYIVKIVVPILLFGHSLRSTIKVILYVILYMMYKIFVFDINKVAIFTKESRMAPDTADNKTHKTQLELTTLLTNGASKLRLSTKNP